MEFKLTITAMPSICDSIDFGLSEEDENRRQAKIYLKHITETFWETSTHIFFRPGNWENGGRIILYNKTRDLISYLVKFVVSSRKLTNFHKTVTQTNIWRSDTDPKVKGLAFLVFFDYLLDHYGAIMSDSIQSRDGKRFWTQMMTEADSKNLGVALVNFNEHKIYPKDPSIDIHTWVQGWDTWKKGIKHQGERFLIFHP
jgi:hypothetical protein